MSSAVASNGMVSDISSSLSLKAGAQKVPIFAWFYNDIATYARISSEGNVLYKNGENNSNYTKRPYIPL